MGAKSEIDKTMNGKRLVQQLRSLVAYPEDEYINLLFIGEYDGDLFSLREIEVTINDDEYELSDNWRIYVGKKTHVEIAYQLGRVVALLINWRTREILKLFPEKQLGDENGNDM